MCSTWNVEMVRSIGADHVIDYITDDLTRTQPPAVRLAGMDTRLRLIIDTDPGVDDAQAILMALAHPSTTVEAITTVAGNVGIEHTTRNACAVLDVAGADVPIFAGADGPLVGRRIEAAEVHGSDGLGDCGRSGSDRQARDEHGANAIVELTRAHPGELTLVCLGPLTNVALATRLDPTLPKRVRRIVVMGGAVRATGNSSAVAEFNVHADPEAASVVFDAWSEVTLVTWEATLAHPLPSDLLSVRAANTPAATFVREISAHASRYVRDFLGVDDLFVPDPLAMAVTLEPDIVLEERTCQIRVELAGAHTRGQTVALRDTSSGEAIVRLIERVDGDRLRDLVLLALR